MLILRPTQPLTQLHSQSCASTVTTHCHLAMSPRDIATLRSRPIQPQASADQLGFRLPEFDMRARMSMASVCKTSHTSLAAGVVSSN